MLSEPSCLRRALCHVSDEVPAVGLAPGMRSALTLVIRLAAHTLSHTGKRHHNGASIVVVGLAAAGGAVALAGMIGRAILTLVPTATVRIGPTASSRTAIPMTEGR